MSVMTEQKDRAWVTRVKSRVYKFESDEARAQAEDWLNRVSLAVGGDPNNSERPQGLIGVEEFEENCLLNEGINSGIWPLVAGDTGATPFNATNARIGVGDSSADAAATQTDLQGINKAYKGMDSGYPTYGTAQKIVFRSTFTDAEANFVWNEWVVDNGAVAAVTLNRKVASMGEKTQGSWTLEVSITLA